MNKRIKKKRHIGKWASYGFEFKGNLKPQKETEDYAFLYEFVDFAETKNWAVGGGCGDNSFSFYVSAFKAHTTLDSKDKEVLENWSKNHHLIQDFEIGQWENCWYPAKMHRYQG